MQRAVHREDYRDHFRAVTVRALVRNAVEERRRHEREGHRLRAWSARRYEEGLRNGTDVPAEEIDEAAEGDVRGLRARITAYTSLAGATQALAPPAGPSAVLADLDERPAARRRPIVGFMPSRAVLLVLLGVAWAAGAALLALDLVVFGIDSTLTTIGDLGMLALSLVYFLVIVSGEDDR